MSTSILTQSVHSSNGPTPLIDNRILVELTRPCITHESRFIIPSGTRGRVVGLHVDDTGEWDRYHWLIDFGLSPIIILPYDSPLLKILDKAGEK